MWALLALYQALRIATADAVATAPADPDRASYQIAAQAMLTQARNIPTATPAWPGPSAAPSWPHCTPCGGPASAPAASNPRYLDGTSTRPASPAPARRSPLPSAPDAIPQRHAASSA
jgi:hypothetical protein